MNTPSRATIVLITFQRFETTKRCIDSLIKHTGVPINFIIVDNASNAPLRELLFHSPGTKMFLDNNIGFYKALNLAFAVVHDELVAILDCDIVVSNGWWQALAAEVMSSSDVGLAGSRYLNANGSLQEGYPALREDGWYGANSNDLLNAADCQYIAIGCSVLRRSAWLRVGGFDESYFINHGDIDFCYKLRYEGGYRVRYCPKSSVIHDRTFGKEEAYDKLRFDPEVCQRDYRRFKEKWEIYYTKEKHNEQTR